MASSSGTAASTQPSAAEAEAADAAARMEYRRKRRMESNRASAQRSRRRKQQLLADLTAQARQLRKDKQLLVGNLNLMSHTYAAVEAENAVLRTQQMELSNRLHGLADILSYLNGPSGPLLPPPQPPQLSWAQPMGLSHQCF